MSEKLEVKSAALTCGTAAEFVADPVGEEVVEELHAETTSPTESSAPVRAKDLRAVFIDLPSLDDSDLQVKSVSVQTGTEQTFDARSHGNPHGSPCRPSPWWVLSLATGIPYGAIMTVDFHLEHSGSWTAAIAMVDPYPHEIPDPETAECANPDIGLSHTLLDGHRRQREAKMAGKVEVWAVRSSSSGRVN
jgi:hypothetical protein